MTRTTKIDAINEILSLVGINTVASLDDPVRQDVIAAEETLNQTLKHIATQNNYYNRYEEVEYTPDVNGYIYVPNDVYDAELIDPTRQAVIKGDRIFNITDKTFVWTKKEKFEVTYYLDFTDLPEVVMRYVIYASARTLYLKLFGPSAHLQVLAAESKLAYDVWQRWEYDSMDGNMLAGYDVIRTWASPRRSGRKGN